MSDAAAPGSWSIVAVEGTPPGALVCLGCGALVLDDRGAIEVHRTFHRALDSAVNRVLA